MKSSDYDLQTLAQEYTNGNGEKLYNLLYKTFTVKSLTSGQSSLLNFPWRRIYTTNYDDIVEFHSPSLKVFNFDEEKPRKLPSRFAVHLHGSIRNANSENVLTQLILNEAAYVRQIAEPSPWLEELSRDLRFASNCFFIGHSLSDHHITAVLSSSEVSKLKTYFVTNSAPQRIFTNRINQYGNLFSSGYAILSDNLKLLPKPSAITDSFNLKSLKYHDPFVDKKSISNVTPPEVANLIIYGKFELSRFIASYPSTDYVIPRKELIQSASKYLDSAKTLIVHSRLGNGKSIFISLLAQEMSERRIRCFYWKGDSPKIEQELEMLRKFGKIIVLIDDYQAAVESIERLSSALPDAIFVFTARSSQQAVRFHEVRGRFPEPIRVLAIDGLDKDDKKNLNSLLNRSGLSRKKLNEVSTQANEIREIILALYKNEEMKKNIAKLIAPVMKNEGSKFVLIATHLTRWVGVNIPTEFFSQSAHVDAFDEITRHREIANDFFRIEDGQIESRSSLFAEYLLENHFSSNDITSVCYSLITSSVSRKSERKYQTLMGSLMQVRALKQLIRGMDSADISIEHLFEKLSRDIEVNQEPLFWLQYAILMADKENYPLAESFLNSSYQRAEMSPNFETYQLDTQSLRINLEAETISRALTINRYEKIIKGFRDVIPMISSESHRFFVIKILALVENFVSVRESAMNRGEKLVFVFEMNRISEALSLLDMNTRIQTGSDIVKKSLERAVTRLVK